RLDAGDAHVSVSQTGDTIPASWGGCHGGTFSPVRLVHHLPGLTDALITEASGHTRSQLVELRQVELRLGPPVTEPLPGRDHTVGLRKLPSPVRKSPSRSLLPPGKLRAIWTPSHLQPAFPAGNVCRLVSFTRVAGQDGSVVQFKIKRHTPLSKLMKAYCERQVWGGVPECVRVPVCLCVCTPPPEALPSRLAGHSLFSHTGLSMRQIRFRFDGQPINETDTPAQLEMEDEDTIDVFQQQTG
ncbi:hypothetical protein E2I00_019763, partial [Balaenoptera physalus]